MDTWNRRLEAVAPWTRRGQFLFLLFALAWGLRNQFALLASGRWDLVRQSGVPWAEVIAAVLTAFLFSVLLAPIWLLLEARHEN